MLDFRKYLLLLSNNVRIFSKTPLGYSCILHFIFLCTIFINYDFLFPQKKSEILPITSISVSVIENLPLKEEPPAHKKVVQETSSEKIPEIQNTAIIEKNFSNIFSKLEKKQKDKKKIEQANKKFDNLIANKLLKNLEEKKQKEKDIGTNSEIDKKLILSSKEEDEIRNQIIPNWVIPAGLKNAENIVVEVLIEVSADGRITKTKILNQSNDKYFKIASQSAQRALLLSSPLKISSKRLKNLREFIFYFNPKDVL